MRIDRPRPRAISGSFFEPKSSTRATMITMRCQGSKALRSMGALAFVGDGRGGRVRPGRSVQYYADPVLPRWPGRPVQGVAPGTGRPVVPLPAGLADARQKALV